LHPIHICVIQDIPIEASLWASQYCWNGRSRVLFVIRRHFVVDVTQQRDSHLSSIVAPQDITDIICFDLHLNLPRVNQWIRRKSRMSEQTISNAPLRMPHSMFEYQSSSCARPSSGSSTKSANGFSSKIKENCLLSAVQFMTVGVMFRKILNPIWPFNQQLYLQIYPLGNFRTYL